ncbi:MAG TPA: peptide ABC transporter substrate-binding protein [Candidatus Acidoferrum sp.]|jgi:peptide/nickel transport system substrate-binding protein|nr:peptide ABC transporter substrate-binding protein [Candidatus Acidoferrum sp.]
MGCQPVATAPKPARGGTAVEALVGAPGVLNPLFEVDATTSDVDSVIYQGLTTVDAQQNVVGLLASTWTISPNHLSYTFTIRNGVRWADGQPFTAADVLFTFHVLQDPEYQEPGADSWRQVGIAAAGPGRVIFTLRAPSASFPLALRIGIIAKHLFDGMSPPQIAASSYSGVLAIGTGPFRVAAITPLAVTLNRNTYADPQPYLDHLIFRTYSTNPATDPQAAIDGVIHGAADLVGGLEPQEVGALELRSDITVQDVRTFTDAFVAMNSDGTGKPYFSDVNVRLALTQAIDRQKIIDDVISGRGDPDPGPIPVADWAYSAAASAKYPYDRISAEKALDAAGWLLAPGAKIRMKGGIPFKVSLVTAGSFPNRQVADAVAQQLLLVGVEADVVPVTSTALVQQYLIGRKYQMALVAIDVGPDPDQYSLWHSGADPNSLNFAYQRGWGVIDQDLEVGRAAVDQSARLAAYIDFQMLIADAAPAIFLYAPHYDYAVSQRVHGVHLNNVIEPGDRLQYVTQWYVNTGG